MQGKTADCFIHINSCTISFPNLKPFILADLGRVQYKYQYTFARTHKNMTTIF